MTPVLDAALRVRPALLQPGGRPMACLLAEDSVGALAPSSSPEPTTGLMAAGLAAGLHLACDLGQMALPVARGWQALLSDGQLSITAPGLPGFVLAPVRLELPDIWRRAAEHRAALALFLGDDLGVTRSSGTALLPTRESISAAARRGMLLIGLVPYFKD